MAPWRLAGLAAGLSVAVLLAYGEVRGHGFVNIDDQLYVHANPVVARGLTWAGVGWAFSTTHAANWHPVTWLSHMLDVELFGLDAGAHHLVALALHLLNGLLLLALLVRLTGALWRSALVAALFALHPLHVESVAWIAERKDVLSTAFLLLALHAYVAYVRHREEPARPEPLEGRALGSLRLYLAVIVLFALGLMAKPMLVTFPALLLLLDAWPLRRLEGAEGAAALRARTRALVLEKVPLLALSAASVAITFVAQRAGGAVSDVAQIAPGQRVANAFASYLRYLELTFWPSGLAVFYPHPVTVHGSVSVVRAAAGVALVVGVSVLAFRMRARRPYFSWGWAWYIGSLVPVIGLVQVGSQGMADRYTYVPLIGVFVAIVWGAAELVERLRVPGVASAVAAVAITFVAGAVTHRQVSVWRDSISLHSHAVRVTEANWKSLTGLSDALSDAGRYDEAIRAGEQAVRIYPGASEAWASLGATYGRMGRHGEAVRCLRQSLTLREDSAAVWYNLGTAYGMLGDALRAADCFVAALRLDPGDARTWANLGIARLSAGDLPRAVEALDALRRLDPQRAVELKALIERAGG